MNEVKVRRQLESHFSDAGFRLGWPSSRVHQALRDLMGAPRYESYLDVADAAIEERLPKSALYAFPRSLEEANLVMSFQGALAVRSAWELYRAAHPLLQPDQRVLEVGAWTGALAAFIAKQHPKLSVVGADAAANAVDAGRARWTLPNLSLRVWDYTTDAPADLASFHVIVGAMPVDFDTRMPAQHWDGTTGEALRTDAIYERRVDEAVPYFARWRAVATPKATLLVVLRLPSLPRFVAVVDAAAQAGWQWEGTRAGNVHADGERLPLLAFSARLSGSAVKAPSIEGLSSWWQRGRARIDPVLLGL